MLKYLFLCTSLWYAAAAHAFTQSSASNCLNERLRGVLHEQKAIATAFDLQYVTRSIIGRGYNQLDSAKRAEAHRTVAQAIAHALSRHLNQLQRLAFKTDRDPKLSRNRIYQVYGFLGTTSNPNRYATNVLINQDCKVLSMSVSSTRLQDWVRDQKVFRDYVPSLEQALGYSIS